MTSRSTRAISASMSIGELDKTRELNYPAIVMAILATGFAGYLGPDKVKALRHAVRARDV